MYRKFERGDIVIAVGSLEKTKRRHSVSREMVDLRDSRTPLSVVGYGNLKPVGVLTNGRVENWIWQPCDLKKLPINESTLNLLLLHEMKNG